MQAAIYARYSSENQRPESIDDQISSCRKLAKERQYDVDQGHIYTDEAASGAREDRPGLAALRAAAVAGEFRVLLIDDLSRLARNTLLLLSVLEELRFHGVRVVSVADGLDTDDQDATVGIQMRGVFNELQLMDLRKKTLRGQIGQKQRGFIVGEATFGYRSVAVGEVRMDKKGRPRPEGYKPGFPIYLPEMAPLYTRRPPSARNSCSSQHRPASEAVSSARGDVRSTGGPVFQAFLRHRSTLGPFLRQSDCVACAARQPAGTGSAQILRNMSPNSRRVRCSSASRSQ